MSRTHHHNARRNLYIMVPETGYFAGQWGALAKRFMKHHVHRLERRYAQKELRSALREADSLEVALLSHKENVHAEVLHRAGDWHCDCRACIALHDEEYARWEEEQQMQHARYLDVLDAHRANERNLRPVKRVHEFDDDAVCVRCGFDGAEHWHWAHNTYEGVAAREAGEAEMPECKQVYWSYN